MPLLEVFVSFDHAYNRYPNKGQAASSALCYAIKADIDRVEELGGAWVEVPSPDPFVGIDLFTQGPVGTPGNSAALPFPNPDGAISPALIIFSTIRHIFA